MTPSGEIFSDARCKVQIEVSRDAMLGLGKAMVRAAIGHKEEEFGFWHLKPATPQLVSSNLGDFPAPEELRPDALYGRYGHPGGRARGRSILTDQLRRSDANVALRR
jgi:hypothetical protein